MITSHRACTNKIGYATERVARIGLAQFFNRVHDRTIHAYRCPFCTLWHLGHPSNRGLIDQPASPSFLTILRRHTQAAIDRVCYGDHRLMPAVDAIRKAAMVADCAPSQDLVRRLDAVQCVEVIELFESLADSAVVYHHQLRQHDHHSKRRSKEFRRRRAECRGAA